MSSYVIFHAFLPNYQPPLFGCTYQYCHNFKYYEGKELVQGGGCNFLPCDVVDKFKCVDDLELKAEVENVIRGLAREATYLLKCKIHPIQSGDGSDVGADGECASVHFPPPPPSELPPSNKQTFPLLEGMTGNRLFEDDCIRNMEAVPKRQRL